LGTGTMASYGRPFHHVTFYEIDNTIRSFSDGTYKLPTTLGTPPREIDWPTPDEGPYFNYLHDARLRGTNLDIVMGDARLSQNPAVEELREKERLEILKNLKEGEELPR